MVSKETLALIAAFKSPMIDFAKDLKAEIIYFLDSGLSEYINTMSDKYRKTKTFLFRNEKVPFYDVYFPISLSMNNAPFKVINIEDIFDENNYVTIIGNAGSGKSMLLKHLFLSSIKTLYKIPIVIELRSLNDFDAGITEFLYQVIFNNKLSPNKKILERILSSGEFIFLLDGFDEIYSEHKNKISSDLDSFIDRYSKNQFLITSRPNSGIESLPRFNNYEVQPLSRNEIFEFIELQLKNEDVETLASKIKAAVQKPENEDYQNFLGSPLLLSMFILTFNSYPELPKKKSKFYWNVFDTLASKHDTFTKKGGFQHERKTGLFNEDFENILKWFSYVSLFEGKYTFDSQYLTNKLGEIKNNFKINVNIQKLIDDLTLAISIIIIDGLEYKFPHKSMQEYFCASLIKDQDPQVKEKIYSEKLDIQGLRTWGGNENFWNLCYELDKVNFTRFFIIRNLEIFLKKFDGKSDLEAVKILYEIVGFRDGIILTEGGFQFHSYIHIGSIEVNLLRHLELISYDTLSLRRYYEKYPDEYKSFFENSKYHSIDDESNENEAEIYYARIWCKELETLLQKTGVSKLVYKKIEAIKEKVQKLKLEVIEDEKSNMTLLDIK